MKDGIKYDQVLLCQTHTAKIGRDAPSETFVIETEAMICDNGQSSSIHAESGDGPAWRIVIQHCLPKTQTGNSFCETILFIDFSKVRVRAQWLRPEISLRSMGSGLGALSIECV